jgi:predicted Zn-dependent protease
VTTATIVETKGQHPQPRETIPSHATVRARDQDRIPPEGSQVNPGEDRPSHLLGNTGDSTWSDALADAVRERPHEITLFHEARCDLTVEIDRARDETACRPAFSLGLAGSAGGGGRGLFRSDPVPDDAARLAASLSGSRAWASRSERAEAGRTWPLRGDDGRLAREAEAVLAAAMGAVEREAPRAALHGTWTRFAQRILVTLPDGEVAEDLRLGGWLRLEARLGVARAVAEGSLPRHEALGREECLAAARSLARALHRRAAAREARPGETAVVFGPGVGGVLAHEIVGHALEADAMLAGGTWLSRRRDRVAAPGLSVLDDPRRGRGAWSLDDEGVRARPVALVRSGVVAGRLHDRRTARVSGEPETGHARRSSYRHPILPRMGCTFVAAGPLAAEEVVASVTDGVYVRSMEAATTDLHTGRAMFRVTDADRIERGSLKYSLHPFLLAIDGARALAEATRIGDDLAFDTCIGSCVRGGQPLSTSVGGPTFSIGLATIVS